MNKTLYLECYSGISGDMTVAALLDLGASQEVLRAALNSLDVDGFELQISRVVKNGLDACDFRVVLDEVHENHDHDMEYLHGHRHEHNHEYQHNHAHEHSHDHNHAQKEEHHHRGLLDILPIIEDADMTSGAKKIAKRVFEILAEAEAKAHGTTIELVHFHEVGAVDSIVDIIAVAVCLDNLGISEVIITHLCEGKGIVRCQHGLLPVPVPAVANIVAAHHLHLEITDCEGEFVTPTGAAIAAAIRTSDALPKKFSIEKIGLGAGKRKYERPGLLRAMLIQADSDKTDTIYKLESNIDDCSGEAMGMTMSNLMKAGARDVHFTPVYMKKNRPAYQLNVICKKEDIPKMEQIIFENTTTIGIRRVEMERTILKRHQKMVKTSFGEVEVKVCESPSGLRIYPEYESIRGICDNQGLSYITVYEAVKKECEEALQSGAAYE